MTTRLGSTLRRMLWRTAWAVAGGLRVRGRPPRGPAVVVANHSSHADSAALLAALPARSRPVFAAAEDYWFDVPWRRALVGSLAAAVPVRRHAAGGYDALRCAVGPRLARGDVVVVYPEGTRATDDGLGEFRSGALRLARDLDVPLVPVALVGTADVLPKHGGFSPRAAEIRFGAAVTSTELEDLDAAEVRQRVLHLRDAPMARRVSPVWQVVSRRACSRAALAIAFAWGVAEALSWPVIAEMSLVLFAVAVPRRILPLACALATGSAVGVALHAWLAARGAMLPMPLTTPNMRTAAAQHLEAGPAGVWQQMFNGIPIKVYAAEAGRSGMDVSAFATSAGIERATRIVGVGAVLTVVANALHPWLRRFYGTYLMLATTGFIAILAVTVERWS